VTTEHKSFLDALRSPRFYLLVGMGVALLASASNISFWLPSIIKRSGTTSPLTIGLMSMAPYVIGVVAQQWVARRSDSRRTPLARRRMRDHLCRGLVFAATRVLEPDTFSGGADGDGRWNLRDHGAVLVYARALPEQASSCRRHCADQYLGGSRELDQPGDRRLAERIHQDTGGRAVLPRGSSDGWRGYGHRNRTARPQAESCRLRAIARLSPAPHLRTRFTTFDENEPGITAESSSRS